MMFPQTVDTLGVPAARMTSCLPTSLKRVAGSIHLSMWNISSLPQKLPALMMTFMLGNSVFYQLQKYCRSSKRRELVNHYV